MASVVRVKIDGTDVTNVSIAGSWTPRLNRPAQASITIPMDAAIGDAGSKLKIELDTGSGYNIVFHGFILNTETDTGKDGGTTVYNAQDPMELWQWRPVRADDADFSKPVGSGLADGTDLIATYVDAPSIMQAVLTNTVANPDGPHGGGPPLDAEGDIFLDLDTPFPSGGAPMYGAPVDWPMSIAEFASLLMSTGQLDLVITPTDPGGGVMGTLSGYDGNYGTDLSGSVLFSYGMGAYNVDSVRWNRDMTNIVNKYYIFGGPRVKTAADPASEQHWCFNIQGFDGGLAYPPGGQSVDVANAEYFGADPDNPLGHRIYASRTTYGVRMKIDIFDAYDDNCIPGFGAPGRELYRYQWQTYSWFSANPREIIHITPTRDTELGSFGIGDIIGVEATTDVRGGFSGAQRVYEYTVSWDEDSVLTLSEIQTSADQE